MGVESIRCEAGRDEHLHRGLEELVPIEGVSMVGMILFAILAAFGLTVFAAAVKIIGQAEVMVIERLGRFHRVARSGLNILVPFIESPRSIDVRYFEADVSGIKRITAGHTTRIDLRE